MAKVDIVSKYAKNSFLRYFQIISTHHLHSFVLFVYFDVEFSNSLILDGFRFFESLDVEFSNSLILDGFRFFEFLDVEFSNSLILD